MTLDRPPVVEMRGVRFAWGGRGSFELAVEDFTVARGERLLLTGPSGSGKSTLLSLLCGTLVPQAGRVAVLGQDLGALSGPARDRFRAEHIGVVFQMFNLLPYLSILDNVLLPLGFARARRARANAAPGGAAGEARRLLESLGLDLETLKDSTAARLSVGQQQRVAAARALIGSPDLLVADEPTSALDRDLQDAFLVLLFAEIARAGSTLVMVSHEERFGTRFDRVTPLASIARGADGAAGRRAGPESAVSGARAA